MKFSNILFSSSFNSTCISLIFISSGSIKFLSFVLVCWIHKFLMFNRDIIGILFYLLYLFIFIFSFFFLSFRWEGPSHLYIYFFLVMCFLLFFFFFVKYFFFLFF